jgi:hypothetical protein
MKRQLAGDELTTVSVRMTSADLARLDALVESGYAASVDDSAIYIPKNRGAAIRRAIRDAAAARRVSVPKDKKASAARRSSVFGRRFGATGFDGPGGAANSVRYVIGVEDGAVRLFDTRLSERPGEMAPAEAERLAQLLIVAADAARRSS